MAKDANWQLIAEVLAAALAGQDKVVVHAKRVVPTGEYGNTNNVEVETWVTRHVDDPDTVADVHAAAAEEARQIVDAQVEEWRQSITKSPEQANQEFAEDYARRNQPDNFPRPANPPQQQQAERVPDEPAGDGAADARGWKPGDVLVSVESTHRDAPGWFGFDQHDRLEIFPTIDGAPGKYRSKLSGGNTSPAAFMSDDAQQQLLDLMGVTELRTDLKHAFPGPVRVQWVVEEQGSDYKGKFYYFTRIDSFTLIDNDAKK